MVLVLDFFLIIVFCVKHYEFNCVLKKKKKILPLPITYLNL